MLCFDSGMFEFGLFWVGCLPFDVALRVAGCLVVLLRLGCFSYANLITCLLLFGLVRCSIDCFGFWLPFTSWVSMLMFCWLL